MTASWEHSEARVAPELTLGWRLQMALRQGGVGVRGMADELGMARNSVSRWMADRGPPPRAVFVTMGALRTGVPYHWIATGHAETPAQGDPDGGCALCARRDSNPQPSDP